MYTQGSVEASLCSWLPTMSRSINGIALLPFTTALTTVRKDATKVHLRPEIRLFGCRVTGGVCCEFGIELYTSKAPDVRPGHQAAHSRRVANEGARARRRASAELWGTVMCCPFSISVTKTRRTRASHCADFRRVSSLSVVYRHRQYSSLPLKHGRRFCGLVVR
jgi:hypothetical protein